MSDSDLVPWQQCTFFLIPADYNSAEQDVATAESVGPCGRVDVH